MNRRAFVIAIAALFFSSASPGACGEDTPGSSDRISAVELGAPFTDHAVLQRGKPITVWGTARPSSKITITFADQTAAVTADETGSWRTSLNSLDASSEPQTLAVRCGTDTLTCKDILVGEVWMATGQSNMGWRVMSSRPDDFNIALEDQFDQIRILNVPKAHSLKPRTSCEGSWTPSTDKMALRQHSACAYFFARELHQKLKVPIGIIDPSFGGTHIDSWIAPSAWALEPTLAETHKTRQAYPADSKHGASRVFNAGVYPFVGYAMRGFIWHQGEGNAQDGYLYKTKLQALVKGYRDLWKDADLHFGIGQLYPYQSPHRESPEQMGAFCQTSWAQAMAGQEIENAGTILLGDLGQPFDIHPDEKLKMGHRYALWARAKVYGETELVHCGPIPNRIEESKDEYHVYFDHVGDGLTTRDAEEPRWFRFQCQDRYQPPYSMAISPDRQFLIVRKPGMRANRELKLQHAWHNVAIPNLMNSAGLPASVFELDLTQKSGIKQSENKGVFHRPKPPGRLPEQRPAPATPGLTMCQVFSDAMVLQRDKPVPVWGWSKPGVTVTVRFASDEHTTTAGDDGFWKISLSKMSASATPRTMNIKTSGCETHEIRDILVGEVWLGSGQSNMGWRMYGTCAKSQKTFVEDDLPGLRVFHTERAHTYQPQCSVRGRWIPNRDKTALSQTSSLAYFFGRKLHLELGVPVGIIHSSEGGSPIRAWIPIEGLETQPLFAAFLRQRRIAHGEKPESCGLELSRYGIGNYDAMLHPLVPYALRGFIWHQGEHDGSSGDKYRLMLHALIDGWRTVWNDDTLHVGIGQLYAYSSPHMNTWKERERWVMTQFAQYRAGKEIDRAQCIVLNDFSTPFDIHPKNKLDAAERYAAWALCETYGRDVLPCGPDPISAVFDPRTRNFTLTFDHVGDGLKTSDRHDVKWFQIGDSTGRWVGARARFLEDGGQLLVRTNVIGQLKPPYRIRHAWSNVAMPNLVNSAGMPASCFEIDVKQPKMLQ